MDFETGEVYYEYNGNVARVPASMTKIMSLYVIYEAIEDGKISLNTNVPLSKNVRRVAYDPTVQGALRNCFNEKFTVDEMLNIIIVYSASDAVVAMAELVGGTEANFVKMMNAKVSEMGIDAYYKDCCGLVSNEITPVGMATLARNIIKDYPDIIKRSSQKSITFHGRTYTTTNRLLDTYYYKGADGLKTGTTTAAKYCFCGTAVRNGRRMIAVTMASSSAKQRFLDVSTLLDYGFKCAEERMCLKFTDMRTFINGDEIPTFVYNREETHAAIVAQDLKRYGFDVVFDKEENLLVIERNHKKEKSPFSEFDYYRNKDGQNAYKLIDRGVKVVLRDGEREKVFEDVYDSGDYISVSVDEFKDFYGFVWDDAKRAIYIDAGNEKVEEEAEKETEKEEKANDDVSVVIDENYKMEFADQKPVIVEGRAMIPVRELLEKLGKKVDWNDESRQAIISDGMTTVKLSPGNNVMIKEVANSFSDNVYSEEVALDVAPIIVNGRVLLPIRAVVEAFGSEVVWENDTRTIFITAGMN